MEMLERVFDDQMSFQLGFGKREWNLATSSVEVEFHLHTSLPYIYIIVHKNFRSTLVQNGSTALTSSSSGVASQDGNVAASSLVPTAAATTATSEQETLDSVETSIFYLDLK